MKVIRITNKCARHYRKLPGLSAAVIVHMHVRTKIGANTGVLPLMFGMSRLCSAGQADPAQHCAKSAKPRSSACKHVLYGWCQPCLPLNSGCTSSMRRCSILPGLMKEPGVSVQPFGRHICSGLYCPMPHLQDWTGSIHGTGQRTLRFQAVLPLLDLVRADHAARPKLGLRCSLSWGCC